MVNYPDTATMPVRDDESEAALLRHLAAQHELATSDVVLGDQHHQLLRPASAEALIDEEAFAEDERLPYWADLWPSATVLAGYVAALPGSGMTLLELGCGLGLVSAAAAGTGFQVLATDYYRDALPFAALNAWRLVGRTIRTRHVDWRDLPDDLGTFDVVVASDVLYERQYAALVAAVFSRTLARGGNGWLADPGRVAMSAFLDECGARSLSVAARAVIPYVDGDIRQQITVYQVAWVGDV